MSATSIGLPKLKIAFEAAARQTINRSKKGYAAVFVRDAKAQGLHRLSSDTMIPSELGEANRSYIKTAFVGSDRGQPSLVYLVVIPTGTEDTSALEGGLKLLESVSVDYLAAPADATEGELTALNQWVADQRAKYRTVKLVRPFGSKGSDSMGVIELDETGMADANGAVTAGTACGRLAGLLAGIPMGMSATYAPLPELTAVTPRTEAEQTKAIDEGKLVLIHDGQKAKIAQGGEQPDHHPCGGQRGLAEDQDRGGDGPDLLFPADYGAGQLGGPVPQHLRQQAAAGGLYSGIPPRAGAGRGAESRGELL